MVCCDGWREGRSTGPVSGCMNARKKRSTNRGQPLGPTSPGRPNISLLGAVAHERGAMHNGTSRDWPGQRNSRSVRRGVAPKPTNAVIPPPPIPIPKPKTVTNEPGYINIDRPGTQPARRWSLYDGQGGATPDGTTAAIANEAAPPRDGAACMAAAHGAGETPIRACV